MPPPHRASPREGSDASSAAAAGELAAAAGALSPPASARPGVGAGAGATEHASPRGRGGQSGADQHLPARLVEGAVAAASAGAVAAVAERLDAAGEREVENLRQEGYVRRTHLRQDGMCGTLCSSIGSGVSCAHGDKCNFAHGAYAASPRVRRQCASPARLLRTRP